MKIIVTGGSGFIGTALVQSLIESNFDVISLDIAEPKLSSHFLYWKKIDIRNFIDLCDVAIQFQPDYIINLAADLGMHNAPIEMFDTNVLGVENIVKLTNKLNSLKRVIYASSLLVCKNGYIPSSFDDYCPPNVYGESKVLGEKIVKNLSTHRKWVIVRPTSVWGPWFQYSYKKFFKAIKRRYYFQPGFHSPVKPICFVGNATFMMSKILVANENDVNGKYFYLADYPTCTTREWAKTIRNAFGYNDCVPVMPIFLLRLAAYCGDFIAYFGVKDPIFSSFRLTNMLTGAVYPTAELKHIVTDLPYDLSSSVEMTITWMQDQGEL